MSLRTRILSLLAIVAAAVMAMAVMVHLTISGTDFYQGGRLPISSAVTNCKAASRFSNRSPVLLLGDQRLPIHRRKDVETAFASLQRVTGASSPFLRRGRAGDEAEELAQVDRLRTLYDGINGSVDGCSCITAAAGG
jgi:hypothetical protein